MDSNIIVILDRPTLAAFEVAEESSHSSETVCCSSRSREGDRIRTSFLGDSLICPIARCSRADG